MDPSLISSIVIGVLVNYLAKGAGEFTAEKVKVLYQTVKQKLQDDVYAEQTLARTEDKPESEARQAALGEILTEKFEKDPDFAETVRRLVQGLQDSVTGKAYPIIGNYIIQTNRGKTATITMRRQDD